MKCEIKNLQNKKVGEVDLSKDVFAVPARQDIITRVVNWQLAKRRQGTHKTKGISEVSGTTKKPWRQKGTGRARTGSLRSPIFRGGGTVFGPVVRDHGYLLPKKVRKLGLKSALSAKLASKDVIIIESLKEFSPKTKEAEKQLKNLGVESVLIVDTDQIDSSFVKGAQNLVYVDFIPQQGLNVYDILRHDKLVLTKEAVSQLEQRLK